MRAYARPGLQVHGLLKPAPIGGSTLAKPNYQFEKRQRDLAKKRKQEEKRLRKLAAKTPEQGAGGEVPAEQPEPPQGGESGSTT